MQNKVPCFCKKVADFFSYIRIRTKEKAQIFKEKAQIFKEEA
jgi:hypothetical protein